MGVKFEFQFLQKVFDFSFIFLQRDFVLMQDDEVIDVAGVVFGFEFVLDELVEFVEVDVCEELACPVA